MVIHDTLVGNGNCSVRPKARLIVSIFLTSLEKKSRDCGPPSFLTPGPPEVLSRTVLT